MNTIHSIPTSHAATGSTIGTTVARLTKTGLHRIKKNQRGFSLMEFSLWAVVVAILVGAMYFAFAQNQRRAEVQNNITQITVTAANLQRLFGNGNQYAAVTTALMVQSRAIPDELRIGGVGATTAGNSYGGLVSAGPTAAAVCGGAGACVDLNWTAVKQSQCIDLVTGVESSARVLTVAGDVVKPLNGTLNMATLATACERAATSDLLLAIGRN